MDHAILVYDREGNPYLHSTYPDSLLDAVRDHINANFDWFKAVYAIATVEDGKAKPVTVINPFWAIAQKNHYVDSKFYMTYNGSLPLPVSTPRETKESACKTVGGVGNDRGTAKKEIYRRETDSLFSHLRKAYTRDVRDGKIVWRDVRNSVIRSVPYHTVSLDLLPPYQGNEGLFDYIKEFAPDLKPVARLDYRQFKQSLGLRPKRVEKPEELHRLKVKARSYKKVLKQAQTNP